MNEKNFDSANERINEMFGTLEGQYARLKEQIAKELCEYYEMYAHAERQAADARKNVPARAVMEVFCSTLADILNDVRQASDLDTLKANIELIFRSMRPSLKAAGVELSWHSSGDTMTDTEQANFEFISTSEPALDGRVAFTEAFGCAIKGEEPLLETVTLYRFDPSLKPVTDTSEESAVGETESSNEADGVTRNTENAQNEAEDVTREQEDNAEEELDAVLYPNGTLRLLKPVFFSSENGAVMLYREGETVLLSRECRWLKGAENGAFYELFVGNEAILEIRNDRYRFAYTVHETKGQIELFMAVLHKGNSVYECKHPLKVRAMI